MSGVVRVFQIQDLTAAKFNNTIVPNATKPELSELLLADGEVFYCGQASTTFNAIPTRINPIPTLFNAN